MLAEIIEKPSLVINPAYRTSQQSSGFTAFHGRCPFIEPHVIKINEIIFFLLTFSDQWFLSNPLYSASL